MRPTLQISVVARFVCTGVVRCRSRTGYCAPMLPGAALMMSPRKPPAFAEETCEGPPLC
jgi:hypothetical protein